MFEQVTEIPNLGAKSSQMLAAANIFSAKQIRDLGPVVTFLAVQQSGQNPSLNLLWAIAAGLQKRHWTDLSQKEKERLLKQMRKLTE